MKSYYGVPTETHQRSFNGTIPDPLRLPLPQYFGFAIAIQNCNRYYLKERVKLRTANLADTFTGSIRTWKKIGRKGSAGVPRECPIFWVPPGLLSQ